MKIKYIVEIGWRETYSFDNADAAYKDFLMNILRGQQKSVQMHNSTNKPETA